MTGKKQNEDLDMRKVFILFFLIAFLVGCDQGILDDKKSEKTKSIYTNEDRLNSIPQDILKETPESDDHSPILHSNEYEKPIPLDIISTAGAEDSPFIPANREELYFVFIKDVREDVHIQIRDIVNGIWKAKYIDEKWQEPELVILQDEDSLALNGCTYVSEDKMYFCSAREGYTGLHWFMASYKDGEWSNWEIADFKEEFKVGELHIHNDEIYYHSDREGSLGSNDIWMMKKEDDDWSDPQNISIVNTEYNEGMPYISSDGNELWFNREYEGTPAVFRSIKAGNDWTKPELIVSRFAGEPTLDKYGNLYFVHHYYKNGVMIEADIYIAYKK